MKNVLFLEIKCKTYHIYNIYKGSIFSYKSILPPMQACNVSNVSCLLKLEASTHLIWLFQKHFSQHTWLWCMVLTTNTWTSYAFWVWIYLCPILKQDLLLWRCLEKPFRYQPTSLQFHFSFVNLDMTYSWIIPYATIHSFVLEVVQIPHHIHEILLKQGALYDLAINPFSRIPMHMEWSW